MAVAQRGPGAAGRPPRGQRGCLSCHGPGGRLADPEGTRGIGSVPSFEHDDVTAYAKSEGEIREWILDGKPRRLREEPAGRAGPAPADARLGRPALTSRGRSPRRVREGRLRLRSAARSRGGGPRRRRAPGLLLLPRPAGPLRHPEPGSLKGYVPAWSGADFPELARDEGEIREWIRDGGPKRLRDNPLAAFFMRRQAIRMPAYGDRVSEDEVREITAYIRWLRRSGPSPGTAEPRRACARSFEGRPEVCYTGAMSDDKRSSPRVLNVVEVDCHTIDGTDMPVAARISDLSTTGAFLDSMNGLPPGTRLALRFMAGQQEVRVAAEVVHTMPQFRHGRALPGPLGRGTRGDRGPDQGAGLEGRTTRRSKTTPVELPAIGRNVTRTRSRPRRSPSGIAYSTG